MMHHVAVYGSLRKGMINHIALRGSMLRDIGSVKGTLYSNGMFPILSLDGDTDVAVEVYWVDDNVLEQLDWLEGYENEERHWYNRTAEFIEVEEDSFIEAYVYHQTKAHNMPIVESGDWVEYVDSRE